MSDRPDERRVLVVDDDATLLKVHARVLGNAGLSVDVAADGRQAIALFEARGHDVILSDIDMPGMNGIELLDNIRRFDLDVPVLLITGTPTIDTAIAAVERGALKYVVKPIEPAELVKVTREAIAMHRLAKAKRKAIELVGGVDRFIGDQAGLNATFERALESLYIAYQPIVRWSDRSVYAYEALLRSREPALPHPGAVLDAAERLGRLNDLGRIVRERAIEPLGQLPDDVELFINLHPQDLLDDTLLDGSSPLARYAGRIVLEVTERAALEHIRDLSRRLARLREIGFQIAIDDLGAGYAGLSSFSLLNPQVVKLDMSLIRGLSSESTKQTLVRTMIAMCHELGMVVTAEGIETEEERDAVLRAGCDLMQGYWFARPGDAFPKPRY